MKQQKSFCWPSDFLRTNDTRFCYKNFTLEWISKRRLQMGKKNRKHRNDLCANPFVQPYSSMKEAAVTTDASEKAIGGVHSQDGHLVIYVSRNMSQAEQNYSNIEQEALVIVSVVSRLKQILLRRRLTLHTNLSNISLLISYHS